jgi:hypothetical protein
VGSEREPRGVTMHPKVDVLILFLVYDKKGQYLFFFFFSCFTFSPSSSFLPLNYNNV